jgi:hypothetical protein
MTRSDPDPHLETRLDGSDSAVRGSGLAARAHMLAP